MKLVEWAGADLSEPFGTVIVVEHWDRLARFGVEHRLAALAAQGRRVVVAAARDETTDDLVRDMIEFRCAVTATKTIDPAEAG